MAKAQSLKLNREITHGNSEQREPAIIAIRHLRGVIVYRNENAANVVGKFVVMKRAGVK
jgi:hypothetical protein